ncbi:MAG: queuosine precursor transporter [Xanthomonadaceae bacterium]|nr:queuosine precursor transporter [Xanthomonadaceae bacterium]
MQQALGPTLLGSIFVGAILTSTFLSSKFVYFMGFDFSLGLIVFPFTFLSNELTAELYGKYSSRRLVQIGMGIQLLALTFIGLALVLPDSPTRGSGEILRQIFGLAPRMIFASLAAYMISQLVDIEAFLTLKSKWSGKYLGLRANLASILSQAIDTLVFLLIFLGGVIPWPSFWANAFTAFSVKVIVGAVQTPLLYLGKSLIAWMDVTTASRSIIATPIKTCTVHNGNSLFDVIVSSVPTNMIREYTVLAITSKIVSLCENAIVKRETVKSKTDLVKEHADKYLGETIHGVHLTVKHGILIASAGIDESNSEHNDFILFPKDPYESARKIGESLRAHYGVKNLGILITDSHTTALRRGVTGIALSHWGMKATQSKIGEKDLFGRTMRMTHSNVIDALAVAAVYVMGETSESSPLAVVSAPEVQFTSDSTQSEIQIPLSEDLYGVLFMEKTK